MKMIKSLARKNNNCKYNKILVLCIFVLTLVLIFSSVTFADWQTDEEGHLKYLDDSTNQYVTNNWLQNGTGFYFFDTDANAVRGWYLINGKYYYFDNTGLMQVGFLEHDGKTYYLDTSSGQMVTGWIQTTKNGSVDYYYFADDGTMYDGWNKIGDKWFYFLNGKCLINTFAEVNGVWYHFGVNGALDTGWVNANGKMYYFNSSTGAMMKGWIQDQNAFEYYLSEVDGSLIVNTTAQIGGRRYTFDALGRCVAKDEGVYMGVYMGNNQIGDTYGVNLGVSPSMGVGTGVSSFEQERVNAIPLEVGSTSGPK